VSATEAVPDWLSSRRALLPAALLVAMVLSPLVLDSFLVSVLTRILILSVFGVAFNIAFGFTNLPSFGHAAFYGLGGYGVALTIKYATPEMLILPVLVGIGVAMGYGVMVGLIASRGIGIYFAVLTFAFAQFLYEIFLRWTEFTGGSEGLFLTMPPIFGFQLWETNVIYYISLGTLVLVLLVAYRLVNSPFGNVMRAIRHNEERTEAIGYPVRRLKVTVFTISAGFSAVAGILAVFQNSFVSPNLLFFQTSVEVIIVTVIGGMAYLSGPIAGATLLIVVNEGLRDYTEVGLMVTGLLFVLIIMFFQEGIVGYVKERL